jgi:hypothetical protein
MSQEKAFFGSFYSNNKLHSRANNRNSQSSNGATAKQIETTTEKLTWAFQAVPTLYSLNQKVDKKYRNSFYKFFSIFASSQNDLSFENFFALIFFFFFE